MDGGRIKTSMPFISSFLRTRRFWTKWPLLIDLKIGVLLVYPDQLSSQ